MSLEGKIALVTGASRGIGKSIAIALAKAGATVAGTATSEGGGEKISAYLKEAGLSGQGFVLNVCDQASVDNAIASINESLGAPLILVNNAGITQDNLFLRMKEEQWDSVIDTDLNSVFRVTKACVKAMLKARWGRVINITSVVGVMGNPGQANYCAAKAGMIGFAKSFAQELAAKGITANCVAPGFIKSDMTDQLNEKQQEAISSVIPMKRQGEPEEIAAAVEFLVSDNAGYITGQTLHVNGGMFMP